MASAPLPDFQPGFLAADDAAGATPDRWMTELGTLLTAIEEAPAVAPAPAETRTEDDVVLAQRRLGIASSLFTALQCKHAATAGHAMRVALTCSAWAANLGMKETEREQLEIAALLHDIGMIGTPDQILYKPGRLEPSETAIVDRSRAMSLEILRRSCTSPEILRIVEHAAAWYDGSRKGLAVSGETIPLAARMIAIVEAFDSMTTDQVFRPARSHERAMAELFDCAGTQFDPQLVRRFAEFREGDRSQIHREVADRWFRVLDPELANSYWDFNCVPSSGAAPRVDSPLFQAKLLANMYDAVVFVDGAGLVTFWNHGAERLTGISGTSICQRKWHPQILNLADEKGRPVAPADCPVLTAIASGAQALRRLTVWGRNGRSVPVDAHAIPVIAEDGVTCGAVLLLHDASSEISLEQRCQSLAEKATRDPLTQLANRAEFDRVQAMFAAAHQQHQVPCSLLMCDLDRFKQVNDTYGHQAGDDAIKSLAGILKGACRPGDLVARYGGEEFVMLLADCDNAGAARRAEQIRKALAQTPQPRMDGRAVTASFGVTEIQPGDTPETMLRRADRALLSAKNNGRNQVVQLGSGPGDESKTAPGDARRPAGDDSSALLLDQSLITPVPIKMAVEKLRGFVADHQANVVSIDDQHVELEIVERSAGRLRRWTDRPVVFQIDLQFQEQRVAREKGPGDPLQESLSAGVLRTRIHVGIRLRRSRDRRRGDVAQRAQQLLLSFRSYLMAVPEEQSEPPPEGTMDKVKSILVPWLRGGA